jgi:phage repressor protein C with HTH and peptisase S24 domain
MDKTGPSHHTFIERLVTAAEPVLGVSRHEHGFKVALARALEAKGSTLQRWFSGSFPEASYLFKIYQAFSVTPNYLLGIGDKTRTASFPIPIIELASSVKLTDDSRKLDEFVSVPLVTGRIAAGRGSTIVDDQIEDWAIIHKSITGKRTNLISIRIDEHDGMSMYPLLKPGDIVVIDRDDIALSPNKIYAVRTNEGCTVKKLQQTDHQLLLIPENKGPEYKTAIIDLRLNPKPIIGSVIWCSKTL